MAVVVTDEDPRSNRCGDILPRPEFDADLENQGVLPGGFVEHPVDPDLAVNLRHLVGVGSGRNCGKRGTRHEHTESEEEVVQRPITGQQRHLPEITVLDN